MGPSGHRWPSSHFRALASSRKTGLESSFVMAKTLTELFASLVLREAAVSDAFEHSHDGCALLAHDRTPTRRLDRVVEDGPSIGISEKALGDKGLDGLHRD